VDIAIVVVILTAALFVVGRRFARNWRSATAPRVPGMSMCSGGGCSGCAPEPPPARLVKLGRRRSAGRR